MVTQECVGLLAGGTPFLAVGEGPPLVHVLPLQPTHEVPTGIDRRRNLSMAAPWRGDFRVYVVNRKQGLQPGESMSDIAGHLATAIEADVGEPVFLSGTSTGGSVALQLAVDRPDLVRTLVVIASACRLGPRGRQIQQELAGRTRAGDAAGAWADLLAALLPAAVQGPISPVLRGAFRAMKPWDPADMLVTLDAEDVFDVGDQLHRITAPTLVIGGAKDVGYTRELFEQTATGVKDGRAYIYPDWGHLRAAASSTTANLALGFHLAARSM